MSSTEWPTSALTSSFHFPARPGIFLEFPMDQNDLNAKVQRVKELARQLDDAVFDLLEASPNIKVEYNVESYDAIGRAFPIERVRVKLTEIKTL